MNEPTRETIVSASRPVRWAAAAALGMLTLFLLVCTIDGLHNWGHEDTNGQNTITVTGEGTATAIPDTATVSFTASATADDVATAQTKMTTSVNSALDSVKALGVSADDITTTSYDVSPHYTNSVCPAGAFCPNTSTTSGYDVSESVQIKIKDTTKVASVLGALGKANVTNVSGPQFEVADTQVVMQQAREQAIGKAQADAKKLATQLGVKLGAVTYFQDNTGDTTVQPQTYKADAAEMSAAPAVPTVPAGNNTYNDSVSISYEIH